MFESLGISKQSFYQMLKRRKYKVQEQEQIIPLINKIRDDHPRMSARDIYQKLQPCFMGRDQFEHFCMDSGYRIRQLKNYRVTTNSLGVTRFPNLIRELEVTRVNQVLVSDITYFDIGLSTYYLTLIMDLYTREVVGWSASDNLRTESTTIPALHRAIRQLGKVNLKGTILHSDGGGQYYCNEFKALTKDLKMQNSMTEEKVYENAHAERLNGIIKNNYLYPYAPKNLTSLRRMLDKAVRMYNTEKPHRALGKLTPVQFRHTVEIHNNSSSYLPILTVNPNNKKQSKINKKRVNVI